ARLWTGWHGMNDTDATIGFGISGLPFGSIVNLDGLPQSSLSGYNLFQSGGMGNSGSSYRNINPGGNVGDVWIVGASFLNPEGTRKLDGFKLEKVKFSVAPVPEPSTWAMM